MILAAFLTSTTEREFPRKDEIWAAFAEAI